MRIINLNDSVLRIVDMEDIMKKCNIEFYNHVSSLGLEVDMSKKDQQKMYFHFLVTETCEELKSTHFDTTKTVYYYDSFIVCPFYEKLFNKLKRIFGIRLWTEWMGIDTFIGKILDKDVVVLGKFEEMMLRHHSPKTLKYIKKQLTKEGFTNLVSVYFEDINSKMVICG